MLVHWRQYIDPGYLAFVDEARPEVVQAGFYGADFWALTHVPKEVKGSTAATQPVDGDLKASGEFLEDDDTVKAVVYKGQQAAKEPQKRFHRFPSALVETTRSWDRWNSDFKYLWLELQAQFKLLDALVDALVVPDQGVGLNAGS